MKCNTCSSAGLPANDGYCDSCSYDIVTSLERQRSIARDLADASGRRWIVAELPDTSRWYLRASCAGRRAYGVYPEKDRSHLERAGYRPVREFRPYKPTSVHIQVSGRSL